MENVSLLLKKRELFIFWQFNGDNSCYCQLHCPECYGRDIRNFKHYWNGSIDRWEKAFERLDKQHGNNGIYFVFSYGEALLSKGFFECVEMIGKHPTWTLNIITNLMANSKIINQLLESRLVKDNRLFIIACWHPEGVDNPSKDWETFKEHLLMLKAANIPIHVMMVWFPPVIKDFPKYFEWLDQNNFRVGVRRFVEPKLISKIPFIRNLPPLINWYKLAKLSEIEESYLRAYTCPKVTRYGIECVSPKGKLCYAGQHMILVRYNGEVKICASTEFNFRSLGNVFDRNFKLKNRPILCPTNNCGGDFGMLVLHDPAFGPLPARMWRDTFISQVENIPQTTPVHYRRRENMLYYLEKLKCQK